MVESPDELFLEYLNAPDVAALALTDAEILAAVEAGLDAQGRGATVIEPRMHLVPGAGINGHFNVLRGYVAPLALAGVKIVGDFVDNYERGLPSEMGLLNLFDPATGQPVAIIDAAGLTDMRTGAVTALGAKYLARKDSRILGHVGARGTAYWNVRPARSPVRFRRDPRSFAAAGQPQSVCATAVPRLGQKGARHRRLGVLRARCGHRRRGLAPHAAGAASRDRMDQARCIGGSLWHDERGRALAHRHHGQAGRRRLGPVQGRPVRQPARARGSREALGSARCTRNWGEIVAGRKPGRERDDETILLWHRGLSLSDIALGHAMLQKARTLGVGQRLRYR